jgi:DNA-binding protein H-NS
LLEDVMRKPRDFDGELKALQDKARDLKSRKVQQLGELVIATGADSLNPDELAGALIMLAETKEAARKEAWAKRGTAFFQGRTRRAAPAVEHHAGGARAQPGFAQPSTGSKGSA